MRIIGFICAALILSPAAFAQSYGAFGGFNSTVYDNNNSDFERDFGLELGFTAALPIQGSLMFRTGAGFVGKNSSIDGVAKFGLTFLELPATLMFAATPRVSILGGLNLGVLISDSCETNTGASCTLNTDTVMVSLPLGARLQIEGPHFIEPIIEFGMTDIMGSTKIGNSLSIRYIYMF